MKIAITAPTGHIGRALTELLIKKDDVELILLARHPEKLSDFVKQNATVFKGSLLDQDFLLEATQGVVTLFWLTPPDYQSKDYHKEQIQLAKNAAYAIKENHIPRVVDLSSIGAQNNSGMGVVNGLHDVEEILAEAAPNITHLRAAFFFENFLTQLDGLKNGQIFLPVSDQVQMPMVSTADIAQVAADRIKDITWIGRTVMEIEGPETLTFKQAAEKIGKGLGRDVKHIQIDDQQAQQSMQQMGLSENVTQAMLELYHSIATGQLSFEGPSNTHINTKTKLEDFAKQVIKPALEEATLEAPKPWE